MVKILDIATIDEAIKTKVSWQSVIEPGVGNVYPVYLAESAGELGKHNSKHTSEKYKSFKDQNTGLYGFLRESGVRDLETVLEYFTREDVEKAVKSKKVFIKKTKIFI